MPAVVVDTNVLVRAFLRPDSSDGKVIRLAVENRISLYYSQTSFQELRQVLRYPRLKKFGATEDATETFLKLVGGIGNLIDPIKRITLCRDPDDDELLSIASSIVQVDAVFLITADKDLLVLKNKIERVMILTPQKFLKMKDFSRYT
jgi:putative PIN family toxin of toxin-antitoxin system